MDVKVTYKKIKYMHLRVKNGIVCVSAPFHTSKERILAFVSKSQDFIHKQLEKEQLKNLFKPKLDDHIKVLEKDYQILKTNGQPKVTEHYLFLKETLDLKEQIKTLCKEDLYKYCYSKTKEYFTLMNLTCTFPKIIIKNVKSVWGSYNKKYHRIIYSSNLLFKDFEVINYVIVHELSHILEFNHSKNFYAIVEKYCPNYKEMKKKLRGV